MAESNKLKVLYILDIMKKTDEFHPLNTTQIAGKLKGYGISAERKSISRDLECLEDAGYSIVKCENHNQGWYMTDQEFEDYELKILADAIAVAKFLTLEDSRKLIRKIKKLSTKGGERIITATTFMDPALKIRDGRFKFKFDLIMRAITEHKQLRFQYYELASGNQKVYKRNGYTYQVNPYYILLAGEEYYLLGNPATHNHATHFRIEMMANVEMTEEKTRDMKYVVELEKIGSNQTIGDYLRQNVNMWTGETVDVKLRCTNGCRHDIMIKFGRDTLMLDADENTFTVIVRVTKNEGFYQWLAAYGSSIVIESPEDMRHHYVEYLKKTLKNYL